MSIFGNMTKTSEMEATQDVLGGFSVLDTDIYEATIKQLYVTYSKSKAMALNLIADINGREYRETIYVTNKNGENFFISKQTGKKVPLPGFTTINDLCLCASGKELSELEPEEKVVKIYNFDTKSEMPTPVPTVVDLLGQKVLLAINKEVVDKNVSDGNGGYVPSGETREQNVISKVFNLESRMTVNEAKAGEETAKFHDKWLEKNKGKVFNRAKGAQGGTAGAPKAAAAAAPKKSLFAK